VRIIIDTIPHSDQRYDTCGDYFQAADALCINVSQLADKREMFLIAIHELVEWGLCDAAGITIEAIDAFDMSFDSKDGIEPGDSLAAPYHWQHVVATRIEKKIAAMLGVRWADYEQHIKELK